MLPAGAMRATGVVVDGVLAASGALAGSVADADDGDDAVAGAEATESPAGGDALALAPVLLPPSPPPPHALSNRETAIIALKGLNRIDEKNSARRMVDIRGFDKR